MISVSLLIAELERRGIILSLANGEISYRSPKDALTNSDREDLRARRAEITGYLQARGASKALRTVKGASGPITPSVAQEMWRQFAGGPQEGQPIALNIGMVDTFRGTSAGTVTAAIHQVIARYDALRASFRMEGEALSAWLNPAESFEVEQQDLRTLTADAAAKQAAAGAREFCARVNFIEGRWLTRAKVFALPDGEVLAALSSAHMIADAGTRNIIIDEVRDILDYGAPRAELSLPYNDYSLAEREFLIGPQGAALIEYWRRWYAAQPVMKAPSDGTPMIWGNGVRIVRNFTIPKQVLDKVRVLADEMKVTPFLIYLTIFSLAMARWSGMEEFPIRVLGDKRTSLGLANTVGLMFCADAVEIHAPRAADFESVMRGILKAYDSAMALRIPALHFWAPQCVRPGVETPDYPNKIPAVFNYYSVGTAREKADKQVCAATAAPMPWPPQMVDLPPQIWPRRSSPLFLHVMDFGTEAAVSLHFYENVVSKVDQESLTAMLFKIIAEVVPV